MLKTLKHILLAIGLCTLAISCSGDDSGPAITEGDYFISFEVNGKKMEYRQAPDELKIVGNFNLDNDLDPYNEMDYTSVISGHKDVVESEKNGILLGITTEDEIKTNITYTNYPATPPKIEPIGFIMGYFDEDGIHYSVVNSIDLIPEDGVLNAELKYTDVNNASLRGSFSGTLYHNKTGNSVDITNGKFYVQRVQNRD